MSKYITIYQPDQQGEIEKIETIDGVIVDEQEESRDEFWGNVWSFFYSQGADNNEWKQKAKRKPFNDNGREFNSSSDNWEYTTEANGKADPGQCDYEAPCDYQGSAPVWDGYNVS